MHSVSMLLTVEESSRDNIAGAVIILLCLFGGFIYAFGYLRAQMHRANRDYKTTKAAVPGMRKAFWGFWWRAVKTSVVLVLVAVALIIWMVRGDKQPADAGNPQPSPSTSSHRH